MADGQARDLPQTQIAYGVAVSILAVLPLDKRNDGGAGSEELEFSTVQATGKVRRRLAKDKDAGSGLADAPQIKLSE